MKDEFGRNIMTQFVTLRQKTYSDLADNNGENKKQKLKFEDYKQFLETTHVENKINQLEKKRLIWIVLKNHKKS